MVLTSDAATILRELDVVHPAAKLLVMASQQQDAEMGDGTNMVIILAGELLKKAEELLRMGLKTSDITQGYEKAQNYALKVLEGALFGLAFFSHRFSGAIQCASLPSAFCSSTDRNCVVRSRS